MWHLFVPHSSYYVTDFYAFYGDRILLVLLNNPVFTTTGASGSCTAYFFTAFVIGKIVTYIKKLGDADALQLFL